MAKISIWRSIEYFKTRTSRPELELKEACEDTFSSQEYFKGRDKAVNFHFPHCRGVSLLFCNTAEHQLLLSQKAAEDVCMEMPACRQALSHTAIPCQPRICKEELQQLLAGGTSARADFWRKTQPFCQEFLFASLANKNVNTKILNHCVFQKFFVHNLFPFQVKGNMHIHPCQENDFFLVRLRAYLLLIHWLQSSRRRWDTFNHLTYVTIYYLNKNFSWSVFCLQCEKLQVFKQLSFSNAFKAV